MAEASLAESKPSESGHGGAKSPAELHHAHVVPIWLLFGVWAVLIALTYLAVKATDWDLGSAAWNLTLAMVIATVKGTLVALYFMHLRWDTPFNILVFIAALVFVMLFVILTLMDAVTYHPSVDPTYQPEMLRT